jgi:hypothetical protein
MESHGIEPVTIFVSSLPDNLGIEFPCSLLLKLARLLFRDGKYIHRVRGFH